MPDVSAYAKGVMGETAAAKYLAQHGLTLLERRYRSPYGEIDLILLDGEALVFAEVKTRERGTFLTAQQAVTPQKQRRLIQTARCFLGEHPQYAQKPMRFDVVTVAKDGVFHLPNAFEGSEW